MKFSLSTLSPEEYGIICPPSRLYLSGSCVYRDTNVDPSIFPYIVVVFQVPPLSVTIGDLSLIGANFLLE